MNFSENVDIILKDIGDLLKSKNKKYGNSALEPIRIFSKSDAVEQLRVRIDDKVNRIKNGHGEDDDEDTIKDLIGYLVIYLIAKGNK